MAIRRFLTVTVLLFVSLFAGFPAYADAQAEGFVSDNIQKGLGILNDPQLTAMQRSAEFENLLLKITDMKRVALFTLGEYRKTASPADQDAFAAAFQDYSVAVYRSYLGRYAGESLKVVGSSQRSPDDFIVITKMIEPNGQSGLQPLEIEFRLRTDTGRPEITDLGIAGIWLALEERDQFGAFLAQHHGDVADLTAHLHDVTNGYK
jgi:phospholipid transport system substrate-binding protein